MLDDGVYNRWEKLTKGHLYAVVSLHSPFEFQDNLQYFDYTLFFLPFFFLNYFLFSHTVEKILKPFRKMFFLIKFCGVFPRVQEGS